MPVTVPAPSVRARRRAASSTSADLDALADHETPKLKRRLIASLGFLLVLMYFSMGHMMWGWPLPALVRRTTTWPWALLQLLLTGIVMVINQKFFISGFKSLLARRAQHGHAGGPGLHGGLCVEHLRAVRHDRRAGWTAIWRAVMTLYA